LTILWYCGTTSDYCGAGCLANCGGSSTSTSTKSTTTSTSSSSTTGASSSGGTAYITYHLYNSGDSLNTVACSDGANGLETRWGYSTLSPLYPSVSAWNKVSKYCFASFVKMNIKIFCSMELSKLWKVHSTNQPLQ